MAHELQERYSPLVLAKMRKESILKDGVVFNNDYEGNPTSGAVKIPVRDGEVKVSDYDKANGITATTGSTTYQTLTINKDKAVGEIIDGYDAAGVPDNLVADRLDSAGYSLARTIDEDGASVLLAEGMPFNAAEINVDNAYATIVEVRMIIISVTDIKKQKIPDCYIMIILCLSAFINDIPPLERLFGLMISLPLTLYSCKTNRLGGGDIKLAASMGWCVGIGYAALSYFLAQTVFVLSTFHQNNRKFPFAPYICGAFSVILVISEFI